MTEIDRLIDTVEDGRACWTTEAALDIYQRVFVTEFGKDGGAVMFSRWLSIVSYDTFREMGRRGNAMRERIERSN